MKRKMVSVVTLTLLLTSMLTIAFNIKPVKAEGTIYIRADGSIDPPDAPIATFDNVTYTFTGNILDKIAVERDNIVVDGAGYTLQGTGSGTGMDLSGRTNVTVQNTQITTFNYGMLFSLSFYNIITGNYVTNNGIGIYLTSSSNNTFYENNVTSNSLFGIQLVSSSTDNTVSHNNVTGNGAGGSGYGVSLGWRDSNNNNITDNEFTGNYGAIGDYWYSNFNLIARNNIVGGYGGIDLSSGSSNCTVIGNDIEGCSNHGIRLYGKDCGNRIVQNKIRFCNWFGIDICDISTSTNNEIAQNDIQAMIYAGIRLGGTLNKVYENNVSTGQGIGNGAFGIVEVGSGNCIYHNNFLWNSPQVGDPYGYKPINSWDDGYPSGGNYWSDYAGVDLRNGPYQNETGSDGMGDTPYAIDANNTDHYPLMKPFPWDQHDIGSTGISTSKTVCGQGYLTNVSIMMFNYGENTETLNVTAYANETIPIEMVSLELTGRTPVTVNFTWNTTSFAYGNYSISAYATPVENETRVEDNLLVDGWVFVTIPGDVNGDKKVNILDCILIANHFGHVDGDGHAPGSKEWFDCANCDINSDSKINVLDCIILSNNFGQSWT